MHSGVFNSADRTGSGNRKAKWDINHHFHSVIIVRRR